MECGELEDDEDSKQPERKETKNVHEDDHVY